MGENLVYKILKKHVVDGELKAGNTISIKIDNTLTQDSTGTMAYLQLEAMGIKKVKTEKSVAFIDHNMLQQGFENADDHRYIQTAADKYGIYFSRPGNGICHQVYLERFSKPGNTLLGSDSHTPTAGGVGMIAIGAGGLDVALAMAGKAYSIKAPEVVKVNLVGKLNNMVASKDIILEVLRRETVKGGVGKVYEYGGEGLKYLSVPQRATITNMGAELGATTSIFPSDEKTLEFFKGKVYEYGGEGLKYLSVPQRATITNMGAELGATTSIFPSDEKTLEFFKAQGREDEWMELKPDADAVYDRVIDINLDELVPMAAKPHSPDNVDTIKNIGKIKINQVAIGSCTNSSYEVQ